MAATPQDLPVARPERFDPRHAGKLPFALLVAGGVGLLGSLIGFFVAREQFAFSWLFGFSYWFLIAVGGLFWLSLHHATDSEWGVVVRRQMENLAGLIPYGFVFFLPVLLCADVLFKWWDMPPGADPLLDAKQPYLSKPFFLIRAAVYFLALGGVAWLARRHSVRQDADGETSHTYALRKLGVAGIAVVALCLTFLAFDWLSGLQYNWFSTMWGVYIFAGAVGASMSMLILVVSFLRSRGYLGVVNEEHYHVMGKFLLAFTIFWAYIGFSQYMLIWYANIPEENIYFRIRNTESWNILSTILVVGRFFLAFPLLLLQWTKRNPKVLCWAAAWILLMQALDLYIVVLPALHNSGFHPSILDVLTFVGIGGIMGTLFYRILRGAYLYPVRDPRLPASINLTN